MAVISWVIFSCGARVDSVSEMLAMSLTSVIVAIIKPSLNRMTFSRHSSMVPTAGGHAQVVLYIGHSCSQM